MSAGATVSHPRNRKWGDKVIQVSIYQPHINYKRKIHGCQYFLLIFDSQPTQYNFLFLLFHEMNVSFFYCIYVRSKYKNSLLKTCIFIIKGWSGCSFSVCQSGCLLSYLVGKRELACLYWLLLKVHLIRFISYFCPPPTLFFVYSGW